ncbi:MAG TPA: hypothetical protein VNQ79_24990 [Blastocatellia bacterium]|nr:hypothetical protein [Blastocatellia bacterium]
MLSRLRRTICLCLTLGLFFFSAETGSKNKVVAAIQEDCVVLNTTITGKTDYCLTTGMIIGCGCNISGSSCSEIHYCSSTTCDYGGGWGFSIYCGF